MAILCHNRPNYYSSHFIFIFHILILISKMAENKNVSEELIAPCGMNCALCSGYLAYKNKLPKLRGKIHYCQGCRPRNKKCAWLKGHCEKIGNGKFEFCYQCERFPCQRLQHLDERYRRKYEYSMVENLKQIKKEGLETFINSEESRYRCPKCKGMICVHNKKCYHCQKIKNWRE